MLYAFDMVEKKLHVLDPIHSCMGSRKVKEQHLGRCEVMIKGLAECFETYFEGIHIDTDAWEFIFHPDLNNQASKADSGFYVAHYITSFDARKLLEKMGKNDVHVVKRNLLRLICRMESNRVEAPACIIAI